MLRTFVAVEITPEVRQQAVRLIEQLAADGGNVKWVEAENLHLTLNFLGDVEDRQLHEVCAAVAEAAAEIAPFELEIRGAGAFPSIDRPRTVWIGVGQGEEEICQLQRVIGKRLAKLGFPREGRRYHPHLTLGRLRHGRAELLGELIKERADFSAGKIHVDQAVVFSSILRREGPVYDVLSRAELAGL